MKRLRGILLILLSTPIWAYVHSAMTKARNGPFGSEFGSVAYPVPAIISRAEIAALILTVAGFAFTIRDFARSRKNLNG